jgi:peptidoglycan/xylan/chitin deacetylase (PgdA/CDA1 family)
MISALMYHELERPGRPLADAAPGYVRYVVDESRFAQQMSWLRSEGLRGISVGCGYEQRFAAPGQAVITFDDGCESDWTIAAPQLIERGFGATFYVVSRWVGRRPGFVTASQLRELADAGFEVGSHSASHAFLTDLDDGALVRELAESKREIENTIGRAVKHLSCPGGRANRRVAEAARAAGYETMTTSRIGVNRSSTDRFALRRCPVLRDTPQDRFESYSRGRGIVGAQLRDGALAAAKALIGNRLYTSVRDLLLSH